MTRTTLYVLIPGSFIYALLLVAQGVPQNFSKYTVAHPLEQPSQVQTIGQGPVASQEAIKMLGTNGGGFFNANSSHPYENPTPFSNFLQILSIFIIPAGLTYTLGRMTGSPGHGWAVFAAMFVLFAAGFSTVYWAESQPHPLIHGAAQTRTIGQAGGNMEGKEVRNGIAESALFATITTDASCGAVNGMHDSFTPLGGMVVLSNIMLGEVVFGGVGSGLYGILIFVVLAVFIAGLMVGRTPEYLGKKSSGTTSRCPCSTRSSSRSSFSPSPPSSCCCPMSAWPSANPGPHGFTEILYAFTSGAGNNGSAFAGLSSELVVQRLHGLGHAHRPPADDDSRACSGRQSRAEEKRASVARNIPGQHSLFTMLLIGVILLLGALTFFPALSLGPILEHLQMHAGKLF